MVKLTVLHSHHLKLVTGYRYMVHLYCLAVQAGFYSDAVECRTLSPADRVRSPVGENVISIFSPVTFGAPRWAPLSYSLVVRADKENEDSFISRF